MRLKKIISSGNALICAFSLIVGMVHSFIKFLNKKKVNRDTIVVLCFHKLGDSVFTLPALRALRNNTKEDFYIFCFEETKAIYELYFSSRYIIGVNHKHIRFHNRICGKKIREKLAKINPLKIFDFTGTITSASLLLTSSAKEIIGLHEPYYRSLYTLPVAIREKPHILDIYLDVIRGTFPGKDYEHYKEFPSAINKEGYILIHPYAGWEAKEWGMAGFIEIAKLLSKYYKVAFVAQPGLMKQEDIAELNKNRIDVFEPGTINELIDIIKRSSLIFSNDSGPAYIANVLGRPTFTIFGPTNPDFHIPYGDRHRFIRKQVECSPLIEKYCFTDAGRNGCKSFECMKQLSIDEVCSHLIGFINELCLNKINSAAQVDS
jgi:heptosyltransferase-2